MILCRNAVLERWAPDFSSSGQASPTWTRVRLDADEICNTLESVDWTEGNPVQVIVCDACGYVQCASGGYVHISRIGSWILWTTPQIDDFRDKDRAATQYEGLCAVRRRGAIALTEEAWHAWRSAVPGLPDASVFPNATGRVLADAWLLGPGRTHDIDDVELMLRDRLLAGDTLEPDAAIARINGLIDWLREVWDTSVAGRFESARTAGAAIEKLYFDGPRAEDWSALARRDAGDLLAFGDDLVFVPSR